MITFTIPGRLPGLNEIIGAARTHPQASAGQKKKYTRMVRKAVEEAGHSGECLLTPVTVKIVWYERDARRDIDNVEAAVKFILDGLVEAAVIPDDKRKFVEKIDHDVRIDRINPRVEVSVYECGEVAA